MKSESTRKPLRIARGSEELLELAVRVTVINILEAK